MASAPAFRTDVTIRAPASQNLLERQSQQRLQSSSEFLDTAAENVNKQIDNDIRQMLDSFEALMGLSRVCNGYYCDSSDVLTKCPIKQIRDKDVFRIAQENFELEGRADAMVRSAQSLTLLSHSLKLSLLFNQEAIDGAGGKSLDEEALDLIESTEISKRTCAELLEKMFDLGGSDAEDALNGAKGLKSEGNNGKSEVPASRGESLQTPPPSKEQTVDDLEMKEGT